VSGPDRPGILAGVLSHMAASGSELQDIEQITIRGNLDLNLVVSLKAGRDLLKELLLFGTERSHTPTSTYHCHGTCSNHWSVAAPTDHRGNCQCGRQHRAHHSAES
jgi:ACT domain